MQEARYSTNLRYTINGLDEQFTLRNDSDLAAHFAEVKKARDLLVSIGAHPIKSNGSSQNGSADPKPDPPVCKKCGSSEHMELVTFPKNGVPKQAWKCQACMKWAPDPPRS